MLENFKDLQPEFCNEVNNIISNNKVVHAYLIETNNFNLCDDLIISFIKELFNKFLEDKDDTEKNNFFNLIDSNSCSDYISIEPDGLFIKKEQILSIKEHFKTTSFNNMPRIYYIKEADKLNKYAANTLLKFLEEPEGNIIAILSSTNRFSVLETIRSRCQIFSLLNKQEKYNFYDYDLLCDIIETIEKKKYKSISFLPIYLNNDLKNKDFWNFIFNDMVEIYYNAFRKLNNIDYKDYNFIIDMIIGKNTVENIIYKLDIIFKYIDKLNYNLNISMMLDGFIIDFFGGDFNA